MADVHVSPFFHEQLRYRYKRCQSWICNHLSERLDGFGVEENTVGASETQVEECASSFGEVERGIEGTPCTDCRCSEELSSLYPCFYFFQQKKIGMRCELMEQMTSVVNTGHANA